MIEERLIDRDTIEEAFNTDDLGYVDHEERCMLAGAPEDQLTLDLWNKMTI